MNQTENPAYFYDEIERKQEELNKLLLQLSEIYGDNSHDEVCAIGQKICEIYRSKIAGKYQFRHQYHDFIEVLRSIKSPDSIDVLLENLKIIIEHNKDDEFIRPILLKLYDHISIDVVRKSIESETHNTVTNLEIATEKINKITEDSTKLTSELDDLKENTDDVHKRVESIHIEIVAILGVFSAIVIGFTGGLDIIGGALSNVGVKDFSLILFSVSLCGMVLFDVLWLLIESVMFIVKGHKERVIGNLPVALFNMAMVALMIVAYFSVNRVL